MPASYAPRSRDIPQHNRSGAISLRARLWKSISLGGATIIRLTRYKIRVQIQPAKSSNIFGETLQRIAERELLPYSELIAERV